MFLSSSSYVTSFYVCFVLTVSENLAKAIAREKMFFSILLKFYKLLVSLKFVLIFLAVLKPTFQPKQCLFLMFVLIVYISSSYCGCIRSRCSGLKGLRGELGKTINILRISSRLLAASAYRAVNYTVSMVIFRCFSNFGTSSFITCIIISNNIYYTECVLSCC